MSDVAPVRDNASNLINLLNAATTAGVYDEETGAWTGIVVPDDLPTLAQIATTTPTESAYGFTLAQAEALLASVNSISSVLVAAGLATA